MHEGEFNDPAGWSSARCDPEPYREALIDILREAAARWKGDIPNTRREFVLVAAALALECIREAAKEGRNLLADDEDTLLLDVADAANKNPGHFATGEILAELIAAANPRLLAQCYDIAGGFAIQGKSQQQVADEHGLHRAEVSKICRDLKDRRSLTQSPAMRSEHNREVCRQRELKKPKRARQTWGLADTFKSAAA